MEGELIITRPYSQDYMALDNKSNTTNNIKNNTIVNRKEKRPGFPSQTKEIKNSGSDKNP
jgi:hypothetical protein